MRIHNLYEDENGESHFRDIEIEWAEERNFSKYSARMPANVLRPIVVIIL